MSNLFGFIGSINLRKGVNYWIKEIENSVDLRFIGGLALDEQWVNN